jgi:ComF family protein
LCGKIGEAPCGECADTLDPAPNLAVPAGVDACRAVLAYEGDGRELVARLKYRNARASLAWLAERMAVLAAPDKADLVTWVPTTSARRRDRGFDQAQLLAKAVARGLRLPCRPLLVRGAGPPQTGRSSDERRAGPALAVRPNRTGQVAGAAIVVVDDVITTGSTVTSVARALKRAGAARVLVVAAARTPLKRARDGPEIQVQ